MSAQVKVHGLDFHLSQEPVALIASTVQCNAKGSMVQVRRVVADTKLVKKTIPVAIVGGIKGLRILVHVGCVLSLWLLGYDNALVHCQSLKQGLVILAVLALATVSAQSTAASAEMAHPKIKA